jgi:ribonuclease HI
MRDATPLNDLVTIYTDGACLGNPGPGGYGAVLLHNGRRRELSGGYRLTTNNRMELTAAIAALDLLARPCAVTLYSDSRYVVQGITNGWAVRWRANGWMKNKTEPALNPDLWARLLTLCERHRVSLRWVRGHADNTENERCDTLATSAARQPGLPPDPPFEAAQPASRPSAQGETARSTKEGGSRRTPARPWRRRPVVARPRAS